ncbi:MAG: hypothetical protein ACKOCX_07950, partial [Planctomycetota bacterium]
MAVAARTNDVAALSWACPGVLSHDWPANQQEIPTRAARLAKSAIDALRKAGRSADAEAFQGSVDQALVRDLVIDLSWTGDADVDVAVQEPTGTVCSLSAPRSMAGGTLLADGTAGGDGTTHRERYVAAWAFPGEYRILVRRSWGTVAADTVTVEMTIHRGTDQEQVLRRQVRLGADEQLFTVTVPRGRRVEPLVDAQVAQDAASQAAIGRAVLAQQLASIDDPAAAASLSESRSAGDAGGPAAGLPAFTGRGAAGYQPIVSTLPEGTNMSARAVVSADRRYVRVTAQPLFSGVGQVKQFNFSGGGAQGTGGMGGMGGGMGGMGGGMGGMGGMGMGGMGGGMGGMGGGMGGMRGGMGGMGGMGMGGMGMCWVAREVYGASNPQWLLLRQWMLSDAPTWLRDAYAAHGEAVAAWVHDKPTVKAVLRTLMDLAIASRHAADGR